MVGVLDRRIRIEPAKARTRCTGSGCPQLGDPRRPLSNTLPRKPPIRFPSHLAHSASAHSLPINARIALSESGRVASQQSLVKGLGIGTPLLPTLPTIDACQDSFGRCAWGPRKGPTRQA